MNIQGKGALITGGASGLGAATVRMLAGKGAKVTIADINENGGNALAQELGANVSFIKTDVTADAQVAAVRLELHGSACAAGRLAVAAREQ